MDGRAGTQTTRDTRALNAAENVRNGLMDFPGPFSLQYGGRWPSYELSDERDDSARIIFSIAVNLGSSRSLSKRGSMAR